MLKLTLCDPLSGHSVGFPKIWNKRIRSTRHIKEWYQKMGYEDMDLLQYGVRYWEQPISELHDEMMIEYINNNNIPFDEYLQICEEIIKRENETN